MKKKSTHPSQFLGATFVVLAMAFSLPVKADLYPFSGTYSGNQEVPANGSLATGTINGVYNDFTNTMFYTITFSGLTANTTAAHFHAPAMPGVNASVIIPHAGFPTGVTAGTYSKSDVLTDAQELNLFAGLLYSNIHTTLLPGGEIRSQIVLGAASNLIYAINNTYSGAQEVPPNASPGTGTIIGAYNSITNTIFYTINFSALMANTIAAHFHAAALPGVNASVIIAHVGFPTGVTAGIFSKSDVFTDGQEANLLAGLVYSNIHSSLFPGGEIRAQITPQLPPAIICPANISVNNDPGQCAAAVVLNATTSGIPAPTVVYKIGNTVITSPHVFPAGTTTVMATASNAAGVANCSFMVTVNDTEAPAITNVSASPDRLWPVNHKMRDVTIDYTSTDNCTMGSCQLTVTSNEAVNGQGDGKTSSDWMVVDNHHVKLRAERSGKGDGRIYTIRITCVDQNGNTSSNTTTVIVPHSQSAARGIAGIIDISNEEFGFSVLSNPTRNYFTLNIETGNSTANTILKIYDIAGRLVETKNNLTQSQIIQVGEQLRSGIYIAELRQGTTVKQLKLVKVN